MKNRNGLAHLTTMVLTIAYVFLMLEAGELAVRLLDTGSTETILKVGLSVGLAGAWLLLQSARQVFSLAHGRAFTHRCDAPGCQVEITAFGASEDENERVALIAIDHDRHGGALH